MTVSNKLSFPRGVALAVPLLGGGCYSAQIDPDVGGAFACGADAEDAEDAACPESLVCVNDRCEDPDLVPSLAVLSPEDESSVFDMRVFQLGMPPGEPVRVEVRIQGSLTLVSAGGGVAPVFGEGHVRVLVDGEEQATVDSGSIDGSRPVEVDVPALAGPHRIVVQAYRSDGEPYDNPEARASRLFWLENPVAPRPFVAIKSPWPDTVIDLDDDSLTVELATLHFELADPGGPPQEGVGHGHIYVDAPLRFPECVTNPSCDDSYLGVAGQSATGELALPESGEGSGFLTAVLRTGDHDVYGFPFGCDASMPGPLDVCSPVFDEIEIVRLAED